MAYRIEMRRAGGPEVLERAEFDPAEPGAGEIRLRQTAIGLNFIDTYHRSGLYPVELPAVPGMEAAGVVEAVGEGVSAFRVGDRAAYFMGPLGAYASHRNIAAARCVKLPDELSEEVAAAALLKAATAEYLVERCARVKAGDTVLVQAAAGGVGLILVQWLKSAGVRVIGTAGSAEKAALAVDAGADEVILYRDSDVAGRVRALTDGEGVPVVFDGVGKATWEGSLDSLRRRGLLVSYGNASGPVGPVDFAVLARKGSLFATRPSLVGYYSDAADFAAGTARVLSMLGSGRIKVRIGRTYSLGDAAEAHRDLEARRTTGSSVLIP